MIFTQVKIFLLPAGKLCGMKFLHSFILLLLAIQVQASCPNSPAASPTTPIAMQNAPSRHIVLIHGLFMNPESWADWKTYFQERGYTVHTPANPFHAGKVADLKQHIDPKLGKLTLEDFILNLARFIDCLPEKPILIGHSMGGFAVQKLLDMGRGSMGVCIDPAPPKGVLTLQWSFWKCNFPTINHLKGNSPCYPSKKWFHYAFCNTLSRQASDAIYDQFVVPESRNVPRGSLGKWGKVDMKKPHAPLLFIAGEADHIVPHGLIHKNFRKYKDASSIRAIKDFPNRDHFLCGGPGWQEIAAYIEGWIANPVK